MHIMAFAGKQFLRLNPDLIWLASQGFFLGVGEPFELIEEVVSAKSTGAPTNKYLCYLPHNRVKRLCWSFV